MYTVCLPRFFFPFSRNVTGPFAVSVVDCSDVVVEDSPFFYRGNSDPGRVENDVFTDIGRTGGSALSVNLSTQASVGATIVISRCYFSGMKNISEEGRGRGILVSMATGTMNTTLSVEGCSFVNNHVGLYGGGVYITLGDNSSGCNISLRSNRFEGNRAVGGGGAGILMFSGSRSSSDVNHLVLHNNTFVGNEADFAGGAFISVAYNGVEGTSLLVDQCTFVNNRVFNLAGGALYISSLSAFLVIKNARRCVRVCVYVYCTCAYLCMSSVLVLSCTPFSSGASLAHFLQSSPCSSLVVCSNGSVGTPIQPVIRDM